DAHSPRYRHRTAVDDGTHRPAFHQLHGNARDTVALVNRVDGHDVRVGDGRGGARLTHEPATPLGVGGELCRQELESDVPVELGVGGLPHHAHATLADLL